jgi:small subunit ribosomal protein S1
MAKEPKEEPTDEKPEVMPEEEGIVEIPQSEDLGDSTEPTEPSVNAGATDAQAKPEGTDERTAEAEAPDEEKLEVTPEEEGIVGIAQSEDLGDSTEPTEPSVNAGATDAQAKPEGTDERTAEAEAPDDKKPDRVSRPKAKAKRSKAEKAKTAPAKTVMMPVGANEELDEGQFAEMAELYEESFRELEEDSVVKGTVVAITKEDVLVDIGYKSEGSIPLSEFHNAGELEVGNDLDVYLDKKEDQDGLIVLSKEKADFFRAWDRVREVYEENGEIEGTISEKVRGGFIVDIGVRAFLPSSQLDIRPVANIDEYVGKPFTFKVIKVNRRRRNIVLSRKALLDEARAEKKGELLGVLKKGLILEGEVKNITDFGAFIDLGGLDGLLHITDISWGRVRHPSDVLAIGDKVEVMVLDFDLEKERVSLGLKQLKAHPWESIKERFDEGARIVGTVVSIVDYGAFVELEEGIEGLIHISEMSWTHRVKHPSKILSVGDEVEAVILSINEENQRISLGLRQTTDNPWEDIAKRFAPGTVFEGVVRNITDFGAFVELEEGIDGLIRISDISWTKRIRHPSDVLTKGETVRVAVLNVDPVNQRISLGMKQLEPNPWDAIEQSYPVGTYVDGEIIRITNYGAIVRFENELEGLLHISEIAGERVSRVNDYLNVGDQVRVKVINVSAKDRRINLSLWQYKQETGEDGITKKAEPETAEKPESEEPEVVDEKDIPGIEPEEPEAEPEAETEEPAEEPGVEEPPEAAVEEAALEEEKPAEGEAAEETALEEEKPVEGEVAEETAPEKEKPVEGEAAEEAAPEEEKPAEGEAVEEAAPEEEKPVEGEAAEEAAPEEEKTAEGEAVEEAAPEEEKTAEAESEVPQDEVTTEEPAETGTADEESTEDEEEK